MLGVLPNEFGFVILSVVVSGVAMAKITGPVMAARKRCGVAYPNMYATVIEVNGKKYTNAASVELAEEFNCAQRGHQNALESYPLVLAFTLASGLVFPRLAAASLLAWVVGAHTYANNYLCKGAKNRNNGLALSKYVGLIGLLVSCLGAAYSLLTK
mmetsp:Transcript_11744/g.21419  ORF Transcript_11744/g.21419 Transcript_11744/m.21419 type:complete len:156 (-) Transcript_11744:444-911(-)